MTRWLLSVLAVGACGVAVATVAGADPYRLIGDIALPYFNEQHRLAQKAPRPQDYFFAELRHTRSNLEEGKIGLRDATLHVEDIANRYFPSYLTMVNLTNEGTDIEDKIAHQLVSQIRDRFSVDSVSRLERELNEMATH
jgi:hypothetical protein